MLSLEEIKSNEKLNKYKDLVLETNKFLNLTAITNDEEFYIKHFYDSLLVVDYFDYKNKTVMDLGSGAGFPGIPLAILLPETTFYLVEPTTKRANFLEKVKLELDLKNVIVVNKRAEELTLNFRSYFDFIVTRAVSALNILLEISIPFLKKDGYLIALKGMKYNEEIEQSRNGLKVLSSKVVEVKKEILPFINEERFNIIIKKENDVDKKYPRLYSKILKKPL